jgi:hypothetical protein
LIGEAMGDEKDQKNQVQIARETSFMELVREARDLEKKEPVSAKDAGPKGSDPSQRVLVTIPEYAEMSYSEILSELRKIEKIRAALDYSVGVSSSQSMGGEAQEGMRPKNAAEKKPKKQEAKPRQGEGPKPKASPAGGEESGLRKLPETKQGPQRVDVPGEEKSELEKQVARITSERPKARSDPLKQIMAVTKEREPPPAPEIVRAAPTDSSEPKSFSWPKIKQQAEQKEEKPKKPEPAPEEKQSAPAVPEAKKPEKRGVFSSIRGLLGKKPKREQKPETPEPPPAQQPGPRKAEPESSAPEDIAPAQSEAAGESGATPQRSILEKLGETRKKIKSIETKESREKPDSEKLETLGEYWKEHKTPEQEEDPLSRLREYRRKRQREWEQRD